MNQNHHSKPAFSNGAEPSAHLASESERNAMRAYLQRTEVRLSTLHRIAVAFVSSAGLMAATLAYPFVLSAMIPIYALYLVLKDIVHFYYTIYTPGYPATLLTPSFAHSGITFPPDDAPELKKQVYAAQYDPNAVNFMIPFSAEKRELYFDATIADTNGEIIPRTRQWQSLNDMGVLSPSAPPDDRTLQYGLRSCTYPGSQFGRRSRKCRSIIGQACVVSAQTRVTLKRC